MQRIEILTDPLLLPPVWNKLAVHYFQKTEFLIHAHSYNPCQQRYYLLYEDGLLKAAAVVYTLALDVLTFLHIKSPMKMHVVGVPCSVSCPGIFGSIVDTEFLLKSIFEQEKGFVLALNLESPNANTSFANGKTLPTVILHNNFSSWDDYLFNLRADYRRRLSRIHAATEGITMETVDCDSFTELMYAQYLQVYKRSKGKLERLSFSFFQNLPRAFQLTICSLHEKVIGWNISLREGQFHYFFMGGIDYARNKDNATYLRLLSNLVKGGIEGKATYIELGQTAEIPKLKMGASLEIRYMQAHHSNVGLNHILCAGRKLLSYRRELPEFHVFKKEGL